MSLSVNDKKIRTKLYLILTVVGVVLYSIYCFAILPIYMDTGYDADIGLMNPVVPEILDFVGKTVEILAISVFCAILVYGIYLFGVKSFRGGFFIFSGLCAYKCVSNVAADWISSKYVPSDFWVDLILAIINAVVELLPFAAAFLAICLTYKKYKASAKDTDSDWENKLKTFKQLFDLSDFLVVSTFYCSLIVLITKLLGRVINDVVNIVATGLPTEPKTYFMMLANYSLSILFAVFCYFVMLLVISFLGDKFKAADSKEK